MNKPNTAPRPSCDVQGQSKLAYKAPVIEQFGDIRTITLSRGMNGMNDGAGNQGSNMQTNA